MRGKKEFVTNDRNSWFNRSERNTERNNGRCNVPFRGVHVDLAINVSPLMALRTRLDFHWKIPEENFYCKSWQWRWRGPGKVSEKDGWRGPRTRRLQDVQLSPRFERNGSNVTILGWSTGYWLRARFSFEPLGKPAFHHQGFRPPEFNQISRGSLSRRACALAIKREGNNSRRLVVICLTLCGIRVSSGDS